ncbi:MAG: ATP-binding protein [Ktedonobacterales bacterium]
MDGSGISLLVGIVVGALATLAIAWPRLRLAVLRQHRAENRLATLRRTLDAEREEASRARAMLNAILETYPRPVIITDRERRVLFANPAALAVVRLPGEQVIGRRAATIIQDYDTTRMLLDASRTNTPQEGAFERATTGQTWRVVVTPIAVESEVSAIAVSDANTVNGSIPSAASAVSTYTAPASGPRPQPTHLILTIEDLTELRRLEMVRRDFVAHVSHELRTPLAAVKLLSETLVNALDRDPASARDFARRITAETDHLSQMVAELLELSRIESGKIQLDQEPTDIAAVIEAVIERMQPLAQQSGITLRAEDTEALPAALADGERVGEALVNLIHNGLKYTPAGGSVTVSASAVGADALAALPPAFPGAVSSLTPADQASLAPGAACMLVVCVRDSGVGISEDDLPRVFERFFKVDRARTRTPAREGDDHHGAVDADAVPAQTQAAAGTGLGLAITRHLIELHGGRIWAESRLGMGSAFCFTLPLAPLANTAGQHPT